jgi:hypothetical protein
MEGIDLRRGREKGIKPYPSSSAQEDRANSIVYALIDSRNMRAYESIRTYPRPPWWGLVIIE